jgi:hypothetical protein
VVDRRLGLGRHGVAEYFAVLAVVALHKHDARAFAGARAVTQLTSSTRSLVKTLGI